MTRKRIILAITLVASVAAFAAQPAGLDSLGEDALLNELANRGLTAMLERAFEIHKTSPAKRDAIRAGAALGRLSRESESLSLSQKREIVDRVVAGISSIVPTVADPTQLISHANTLIDVGVKLDVNTLEYWGASTATQAQLRPVVGAVIEMLDRSEALATQQSEKFALAASANDASALSKIEALEGIVQYAQQTRAMAYYYMSLCLDTSDPRRAEAADRAIKFLAEYDFEGNPALKNLKIMLGKLNASAARFEEARAAFDSAITLEPPAPPDADAITFQNQQQNLAFEARYFRAVVEVLAKKPADARERFDALLAWEKSAGLVADESITTANLLLEYRILRAGGSPKELQEASALLMKLVERRPELESQVMAQLRSTITSQTAVSTLEPLLLRSLISDAQDQVIRSQQEPNFKPEEPVLARGTEAARELIARAEKTRIDPALVANSEFLLAVFLEAQKHKVEAARAFVDFATAHRDRVDLAASALNNAQRLFAQLGGLGSDDVAVTSLYDQIVPLSIGEPFNQVELCYDWAFRLQQNDRAGEAIRFYRRVTKSDRRYAASRYYLMVALSQQLDEQKVDSADRQKDCREIVSLADEVRAETTTQLNRANSTNQPALRQRLARTVILAADIARTELKDPQRSLDLLTDVERLVGGLADENQLLGEAMFTRVQANMQAGRSDEAVKGLVQLLNKSGGEQGATIVFNMLGKLEADFSVAEAGGDRQRMAKLQSDRAALTPYLVQWSQNNARAEISKFAYSYRVYDAETQRLAAEFVEDAGQRTAKRADALKLFESLDSTEGRVQYKASRTTPERLGYDPQIALGIARIQFANEQWAQARDGFARLLSDHALGTPITTIVDAGQVRQVDNEVYWEATARLIRSKFNGSEKGDAAGVDPIRMFLREQYVRWADRVGGTKWKAEFESLRKELIPDFVPDPLPL